MSCCYLPHTSLSIVPTYCETRTRLFTSANFPMSLEPSIDVRQSQYLSIKSIRNSAGLFVNLARRWQARYNETTCPRSSHFLPLEICLLVLQCPWTATTESHKHERVGPTLCRFFPAPHPGLYLGGGGTREWGCSAPMGWGSAAVTRGEDHSTDSDWPIWRGSSLGAWPKLNAPTAAGRWFRWTRQSVTIHERVKKVQGRDAHEARTSRHDGTLTRRNGRASRSRRAHLQYCDTEILVLINVRGKTLRDSVIVKPPL